MSQSRSIPSRVLVLAGVVLLAAVGCEQQAGDAGELRGSALTSDEVLASDQVCAATGAHAKHAFATCKTCHNCGGVLQFDPAGVAVKAGTPLPTFDAVAKTCANVACHGVVQGTFSFYSIGGDGEPVLVSITYGGTTKSTPSWYSTAGGCAACHDNPPRNGSTGSNAWHSGFHGGQGPTGTNNQCQLCHPDASGANGVGTTLTNPSLHVNGVVNVQASFKSACFGCH